MIIDLDFMLKVSERIKRLRNDFNFRGDDDTVKAALGMFANVWPETIRDDNGLDSSNSIYLPLEHYDALVRAFADHTPGPEREDAIENAAFKTARPPQSPRSSDRRERYAHITNEDILEILRSHDRMIASLSRATMALKLGY